MKINIKLNKNSVRCIVNAFIAFSLIFLYYKAKLFVASYLNINFNFFTLSYVSDPFIILLFFMTLASVLFLVFSSKYKTPAVSVSTVSIVAMLIKGYIYVKEHFALCDRITVNGGTYIFLLLIAALFVNNINMKKINKE